MTQASVTHARTGIPLAESAIVADSFLLRARGLIARRFEGFDGMIFPRCGSIHTCFMGMDIDVLFLDRDYVVVGVREWLEPWGVAGARGAVTVVEFPAGTIEGVKTGDHIELSIK